MGYRSDVVLAFAFETKEQIDEVMAIYSMRTFVSEHELVDEWSIHDWNGSWGLTFSGDGYKWYEGYEDVNGLEDMYNVVKMFSEERGDAFPFAYQKIRIGEDDADIERTDDSGGNCYNLTETLYDRVQIRREIITSF